MPIAIRIPKTHALSGPTPTTGVNLSHAAYYSLKLIALLLSRASHRKPTTSAVIRLALMDYAAKVAGMGPDDHRREACRVDAASNASTPSQEELWKVVDKLDAAEASPQAPLPSLAEVTFAPLTPGPSPEELEERVNATLKACFPRKYRHLSSP